jgi:hypothetical protein
MFTIAAAFFMQTMAEVSAGCDFCPLIGKFSIALAVWTP